jgi:hypothetical protein
MIATSVTYDVVFCLHLAAALTTLVVFVALRLAGRTVATAAPSERQRVAFPSRRNWAARVTHLLPVTGVIMALSGGPSVSFHHAWVGTGLALYLLAAGHLEARTLPAERELSATIARDGQATPAQGRRFVVSVDVLLGLVALALVAMITQF